MSRYQKNYTPFFLAKHRAPLIAITLVIIATTASASCSHDWTSYDPRIDEGSSSTTSNSSSITASSSTSSAAGGMGGAGGSSVGGMGMGGAGGSSVGGMGMGGAGGGQLCVPDTGKACYTGPAGTQNIGACKGGATLCQADGMSYGPCLGQVTPIVEECSTTAVDDDCNGSVNDHCGLWAVRAGAALDQGTRGVTTDGAGNVFITGHVYGSADFGGGVLTSAGAGDIFVAKFDKDGKHLWSKLFGGTMDDAGTAIGVDAAGNSFITGFFHDTMVVGAENVVAVAGQDAFVIGIDPAGQVLGHLLLGGMTDQIGHDIAVDAAGSLLVTGSFSTEINTGVGVLVASALIDGFVVKYDNAGTPLWHKSFGGSGNDEGISIKTNGINDVFLAGYFDETVDFGGGVIGDAGGMDIFVAKFDASGNHVLSKGFQGPGDQYVDSIAVDVASNIFLFGEFNMTINMGGGTITSLGGDDAYLTKLDPSGNHVFTKTYGNSGTQYPRPMTVDKNGDIVFTMGHEGTIDYGGGPISNAGAAGSSDVVVVKLKGTTGAHVWSRRFGNASDQDVRCIATDDMNNIFVGGDFYGTLTAGTVTINSSSSDDAFLMKLAP